jgi:hypothetical protein
MSKFVAVSFDYAKCLLEVQELGNLLAQNNELGEREHILPFFKGRPQLSALCGILNGSIAQADRIDHEHHLFGSFYCDLVVGDWHKKAYCFIEFEDARPDSIFVSKSKTLREYGRRFEHGYSQIIDWFHKIDGMKEHQDCETAFGKRSIDYEGILVIGRDQHFQPGERERLEWRTQHVIVHSKKIHCVTFDGLYKHLQTRLDALQLMAGTAKQPLTQVAPEPVPNATN